MFRGKKYQESAKQIDKAMLYDPQGGSGADLQDRQRQVR